jgi:hypothetical protein
MRKEKALIGLLRGLVDLLADESARNPEFATKMERLLSVLPERKAAPKKPAATHPPAKSLPDIHAKWRDLGDVDFRIWLSEQPIPVLRAIVRAQDMDPTRRTAKWKQAEKLTEFIANCLRARLSRGSAFIGRGTAE